MPDLRLILHVWIERLGRGHVSVAIGYVAVPALGKAADVERLGVLGIKLDSFVEVGYGIDVVASVEVKDAAIEMSALQVRRRADCSV